jgi:hypothetical protein
MGKITYSSAFSAVDAHQDVESVSRKSALYVHASPAAVALLTLLRWC